ncbi:HAD-IA family hydrolase [Streptomyces sp. NPDC050703]|uniref:HAD family hydrolase n=1 Tax=Streptomyces sp. NPDC050703 TaxID=3157218 RepID=UPI0034328A8C
MAAAEARAAGELITRARFALLDFDGPICRLFAGHSAPHIAEAQIGWLAERGLHGLLTDDVRGERDPFQVLRAVDARYRGSDLVTELEERLTQQELRAAGSAWPTPYADSVIRTWSAVGTRLAIATNNSPRAVTRYLGLRGLTPCFAPHIYGRTSRLDLLKPDPHCLRRAMSAMGAAPAETVMIGDTPSDCRAARRAGVGFVGFARNETKAALLREAGAEALVSGWEPVRDQLWSRGSVR